MCTVTFIPKGSDRFILTSNRDESPNRETLFPKVYEHSGIRLLFPKDSFAGGTWIGLSEHSRLICLLNGGFEAHERQDEYRMSRGVIVTDLLTTEDAIKTIEEYNFMGVEPFTIILVEWFHELRIYELVWDGANSHITEKPLAPQIWSSSLLYNKETKAKRIQWFSNFLLQDLNPSEEEILSFHKTAGEGNIEIDVIMDRGFVKTKSITQIVNDTDLIMRYEDLESGNIETSIFS